MKTRDRRTAQVQKRGGSQPPSPPSPPPPPPFSPPLPPPSSPPPSLPPPLSLFPLPPLIVLVFLRDLAGDHDAGPGHRAGARESTGHIYLHAAAAAAAARIYYWRVVSHRRHRCQPALSATSEIWSFRTTAVGRGTGDVDGDGAADVATFRPSTGQWFIINSGTLDQGSRYTWGGWGDIPIPADYDGDSKTDIGVFRPSTGKGTSGGRAR